GVGAAGGGNAAASATQAASSSPSVHHHPEEQEDGFEFQIDFAHPHADTDAKQAQAAQAAAASESDAHHLLDDPEKKLLLDQASDHAHAGYQIFEVVTGGGGEGGSATAGGPPGSLPTGPMQPGAVAAAHQHQQQKQHVQQLRQQPEDPAVSAARVNSYTAQASHILRENPLKIKAWIEGFQHKIFLFFNEAISVEDLEALEDD
ncbi:unnamed protein product, partial [Amoebophrya sp. A120]